MTTYVIADIHGNYTGFKQLIDKYYIHGKDKLIILGDIVDGGRQANQCIEFALSIPDMKFVVGNHDLWFADWAKGGPELPLWVHQGGYATMASYDFKQKNVPESHIKMIDEAPYYLIENNMIFVHGGFNPIIPFENNTKEFVVWDRSLIEYSRNNIIKNYDKVFVGHTTTCFYKSRTPVFFNNLVMCDTGGGWEGSLSLINVDTLQFYQVDGVNKQNIKKSYL